MSDAASPAVPDAPWFAEPMARVREAHAAGHLAQSLLVHADPGAGGMAFAHRVAQLLLCEGAADAAPCGRCRHCVRIAAGTHPDVTAVTPIEDSKQIRVEQVREVLGELSLTSYEGRASVRLFAPAEAINVQAANALLKTLEEPRRDAYLLLVAAQPSLLPATVRSRCLRLRVAAPSYDAALAWLQAMQPSSAWPAALQVTGVAPFDALGHDPAALQNLRDDTWALLRDASRGLDVVRTAETWGRDPALAWRLNCLENCLTGQALRWGAQLGQSVEMRPAAHLSAPELDINIATVLGLLQHVQELRLQIASPLNKGLALERLFWRFGTAAARR